ncbi:MAG: hypothetical protein RIR51_992 [Bacteroidota bacterium]|jgi:Xaa-Pro aminopeptidase
MRYQPLSSELYIKNRKKLVEQMPKNSMAIISSNDIMPTNADGTMGFQQQSDLLYLSGLDQEETILVLFPDSPILAYREIAFLRETSELIAIWEGEKLTKERAREISGIQTILWNDQFDAILKTIIFEAENIFLIGNEHIRNESKVQTQNDRLILKLKEQYPLHHFQRLAPILNQLRMIKEKEEIKQMQKACDITEAAFKKVLKLIKPGIMEYQIEAELIREMLYHGSKGFAYTPIIASGGNACVLHYITNHMPCMDGDLILMDVAAEYGNYNSDLTRTIPVNGKFTVRQKQVYQAVLDVLNFASDLMRPGILWTDYQAECEKFMESKLVEIGLLKKEDIAKQNPSQPLFKKYFMHGVAHHIGLDVHDVWDKYTPFKEGMILTCEPGIYIQEEGLGIRLENNLLITKDGPINLMKNIPLEIQEIEDFMHS